MEQQECKFTDEKLNDVVKEVLGNPVDMVLEHQTTKQVETEATITDEEMDTILEDVMKQPVMIKVERKIAEPDGSYEKFLEHVKHTKAENAGQEPVELPPVTPMKFTRVEIKKQ